MYLYMSGAASAPATHGAAFRNVECSSGAITPASCNHRLGCSRRAVFSCVLDPAGSRDDAPGLSPCPLTLRTMSDSNSAAPSAARLTNLRWRPNGIASFSFLASASPGRTPSLCATTPAAASPATPPTQGAALRSFDGSEDVAPTFCNAHATPFKNAVSASEYGDMSQV